MSWGEGQSDLYFTVQWFCLIWWMNVLVGIMDQYDTKIKLIKYMWVSDLYFAVHLFCFISCQDHLMYECHTWDNGSVWHRDWPHRICVGQWLIFHGPVILPYIFKTIWLMNVIFGIMDQCDTKTDLIKNMWVSDLYFTVQWFCSIPLRLFDGWMSYLG